HPDRDPGDAAVREPGQGGTGDGIGVRLGGDLRVRCQGDQGAQVVEHRDELVGGQQGRCASAEEDGRDLLVLVAGGAVRGEGEVHLGHGVGGVFRLGASAAELGGGVGVEVAVAAAHRAEGDVDVDREVSATGRGG